jgi:hypothetical protein
MEISLTIWKFYAMQTVVLSRKFFHSNAMINGNWKAVIFNFNKNGFQMQRGCKYSPRVMCSFRYK